jgi:hypothetical protein
MNYKYSRTRPECKPIVAVPIALSNITRNTTAPNMLSRATLFTCCILSLTGLTAAVVGCSRSVPESLVGTWFATYGDVKYGVISFTKYGTFESFFTNRTTVWSYEGTWLRASNVLTLTTLKSNSVPCVDVSNFTIVRADKDHLTYSHDSQTLKFVRKGVDDKAPQSSAALDKAKKIQLSTVKFDSLPLAAVITMLHDESVRRDAYRKGVIISLASGAKQLADADINLELTDVTLAEALGRIADSVGLDMQATDTEILLVRKEPKR